MTSRERVLMAIAHRRTDRAPADYGVHQGVTDQLIARLGVKDYEGLLQALNVDLRRTGIEYYQPETGPDSSGYMRNMWGSGTATRIPATGVRMSSIPARRIPPLRMSTAIPGRIRLASIIQRSGRSAQEVRAQVRSYLDVTRDHGGYIRGGSQEFIEDIPVDNIVAMYDENKEGG